MLRRSKALVLAGVIAAAVAVPPAARAAAAVGPATVGVLPAVPDGAGHYDPAKMAACQVKPLFSTIEYRQTVLVYGVYKAPQGAVDVQMSCGVVRSGATYASVPEKLPGPVAALAGTANVPAGSVTACHDIRVTYLSGLVTHDDTCP
ncbi:MAG TPA: hypothetical protein VHN37_00810 [Actinomycetota bacterium]|nr:hypothetical protein [Actinomycetota bacterium]